MKKLRVREVSGDPVFKNSSVLITKLMFKMDPPPSHGNHAKWVLPFKAAVLGSYMLITDLHHLSFLGKLFKCKFIKDKLDLLLKSHILFLKSSGVSAPTLFTFFKIVLAILGSLHFYMNFSLSISTKIACWDFDLGCTESIDQFGESWQLNNIKSSNP